MSAQIRENADPDVVGRRKGEMAFARAAGARACARAHTRDEREPMRPVRARRCSFQNQSEQNSSPTASAADGRQADSSAGQPVSAEQPAAAVHADGPNYGQLRLVHSAQPPAGLSCHEAGPAAVLRRSISSSSPSSSIKVRSRRSNAAPEPLAMPVLTACA